MVLAGNELRPDVLHKRQEFLLRLFAHLDLRQAELEFQQALLRVVVRDYHL
jgi:hypothetical protein